MGPNLFKVVEKLILKNNLSINAKELHLQLTSHPSYPSLHSVTGVLTHFGIDNLAIQIPVSVDSFRKLPDTFIACLQINEVDELVLIEKKGNSLKVTGHEKKQLTIDEFLREWTGVVLAIDKVESKTFSEKTSISQITSIFGILLIICTLLFLYISIEGIFAQNQLLLSALGAFLSFLIVNQEMGNHLSITSKVCQVSPKVNCDEVINSDYGNISNYVKVSDLSFIYFLALILLSISNLIFGLHITNLLKWITILSVVAVPVSLYFQLNILKKICSLCLLIATVLTVQALISFISLDLNDIWEISLLSIASLFTCIILSAYVLSYIKSQIKLQSSFSKLKLDHLKFKRNFTLFDSLHNAQKSLISSEVISGEVVLGNKKAPIHLILVTSPLCLHCRDAHQGISNILAQYGSHIRVSFRINVRPSHIKHDLYKTASILIQMNREESSSNCLEALHYLYSPKANIKKWLSENDHLFSSKNDSIIKEQNIWCEANSISFTPALFLNGKSFPTEYEIEDLAYFIEDLEEQNAVQDQLAFPVELTH